MKLMRISKWIHIKPNQMANSSRLKLESGVDNLLCILVFCLLWTIFKKHEASKSWDFAKSMKGEWSAVPVPFYVVSQVAVLLKPPGWGKFQIQKWKSGFFLQNNLITYLPSFPMYAHFPLLLVVTSSWKLLKRLCFDFPNHPSALRSQNLCAWWISWS